MWEKVCKFVTLTHTSDESTLPTLTVKIGTIIRNRHEALSTNKPIMPHDYLFHTIFLPGGDSHYRFVPGIKPSDKPCGLSCVFS